ncbi:hypothetical protein NL676_009452 [Syzygium grande]|nr:hypothetical protein NL676_009452 [Syzygium grande]
MGTRYNHSFRVHPPASLLNVEQSKTPPKIAQSDNLRIALRRFRTTLDAPAKQQFEEEEWVRGGQVSKTPQEAAMSAGWGFLNGGWRLEHAGGDFGAIKASEVTQRRSPGGSGSWDQEWKEDLIGSAHDLQIRLFEAIITVDFDRNGLLVGRIEGIALNFVRWLAGVSSVIRNFSENWLWRRNS